MSLTLAQIFALNPTAIINNTDLFYLVQSPYTPGTDAGISGASLKSAIATVNGKINAGLTNELAYYAAAGNTLSGLATANNGLLVTSATGVPSILAGLGTTGNVLQSNAAAPPSFSTATYPTVATGTGTLLRADGTNWLPTTSTYPNTNAVNTLLYASSANVMSALSTVVRSSLSTNSTGVPTWLPLTDGQIVIGSTAGSPAAASLTQGSGVTITPGSNSITISATGLGGTVTSISAGTGITLTPNPITTTGSVALTVPVTEVLGGTNQTTYTLGDLLYSSAANTLSKLAGNTTAVKQYLSQTGTGVVSAAPAWATISGADITGAALTKTDDTNVTLTLGGTPATSLLRAASLTLGWTGQLGLTRGGTAASLVASNGGIIYSTASAFAVLSGTATAGQVLRSGASTTPSWSTATYPATAGTSGNVLTSDGTNWLSSPAAGVTLLTTKGDLFGFSTVNARVPVATGDGKVLQVSSAAAVGLAYSTPTYPSASGTSGKFLISDGTNNVYSTSTIPTSAGATANKVILSNGTNYVLSTPTFPNASATLNKIIISDGTNWIASTATYQTTTTINQILYSSAANVVSGLATANSSVLVTDVSGVPSLSATLPNFTTGTITFSPTTGGIVGTTTNDDATTGKVGEFVSSIIASASAVSCGNGAIVNVTSISLTAGDWDVWGNITMVTTGTNTGNLYAWVSSTSITLPDKSLYMEIGGFTMGAAQGVIAPQRRFSLSGTTTIYLSTSQISSSGSITVCGGIYARRAR